MSCVILSTRVAPLVSGSRPPMKRGLLDRTTVIAAVPLSSVVSAAEEERLPAAAAAQLEQEYVVHPSRKDENWTTASGACTVAPYRLSIRWPYMRVQLLTGPSFVSSAPRAYNNRPRLREFLQRLRRELGWSLVPAPCSPAILVEPVTSEPGGDGRLLQLVHPALAG